MGYYSDIKVVLNKNDWNEFKETLLNRTDLEDEFSKNYFLGNAEEIDLDNNIVIVKWDCIKWNEYRDEVMASFMDWLHRRSTENLPFKFIRVGEGAGYDQPDIEVMESFGEDWEYEEDYNRIDVNISIDIID